MKQIEFSVCDPIIVCNMIPVLNRLLELLKENNCNSFDTSVKSDKRIDSLLWILLQNRYGQFFELESFKMFADFEPEVRKLLGEVKL